MLTYRLILLTVLVAALSSACASPTPTPDPTPPPSLNTSLWVDYPAIPVNQQQAVNIAVNDPSGQPVSGATAVGIVEAQGRRQTINFPVTDAEGRARILLTLPAITTLQTITITVRVVDTNGRWDEAVTAFDVYP